MVILLSGKITLANGLSLSVLWHWSITQAVLLLDFERPRLLLLLLPLCTCGFIHRATFGVADRFLLVMPQSLLLVSFILLVTIFFLLPKVTLIPPPPRLVV